MTRYGKHLALVALTVVAAPVLWAPTAGAATCQDAGSHIRCETNGSVSIKAVPTTVAPHVADTIPRNRTGVVFSW